MATNDLIVFSGRKPMGKLDAAERKELPSKDFGLPAERKYPEEDAGHAEAAESRAKQMLKRGTISASQYEQIVSKAKRKLAK